MSHDPTATITFGVFGLIVLAITYAAVREAAAMKTWPVVKGRVLSSKVEQYTETMGSRAKGGVAVTLYRPVIVYEYEVAGRKLSGKRIAQSEGMNRGVPDFAEAISKQYPAGAQVVVHYNPKRPDEAVLEPRLARSWVVALIIGIAMLAMSAYSWFR
jgi:hypothetical protein